MKENNPLTNILNLANPGLKEKAKRAAFVVASELDRIAANTPK